MITRFCFVFLILSPLFSASAKTVTVSESYDSGPGTFRAAVKEAEKDSLVSVIRFKAGLLPIELETPLVYGGTQSLEIDGAGGKVLGKNSSDLFVVNSGADIGLFNISFAKALRNGVSVNVPPGNLPREQTVSLNNVTLEDNGWYGLHFDDQSDGDGSGADSSSSLRLVMIDSVIRNNNNPTLAPSASDKDGIRVDEGGIGSVTVLIIRSVLDKNAAEGIEIDEKGPGDVILTASESSFDGNGSQPQNSSDPEDGLDVDEAGPGNIRVTITESTVSSNRDEGVDLDEAGDGEINFAAVDFESSGNADENIKATQLGSGNISALLRCVTVKNSRGGDGVKFESFDNDRNEKPVGAVFAYIERSVITSNDSDDIQIEAAGGELAIRLSTVREKKLSEGITLTVVSGNR